MSDEPLLPPLRLRPRLSPEAPAPSSAGTPSVPESSSSAGAVENAETTPRIRLKPRLTPAPEEAGEAQPASPVSDATAPAVSMAPVFPEEAPKPKLRMAGAVSGSALTAQTAPEALETPQEPPPLPVLLPPVPSPVSAIAGSRPPGGGAAVKMPDFPPVSTRPEHGRAFQVGLVLAGLAVLLVLGAGGFFAYRLMKTGPQAPVSASVSPPPPAPSLRDIAAAPAHAVHRAQAVVAARQESGQATLPGIDESAPDAPASPAASGAAPAVNLPGANATGGAGLAPVAAQATPASLATATVAFRSWADTLTVSGVLQGDPPRVLINGRTLRPGDLADPAQGFVFDGLDRERRLVVFRDRNGIFATKKY